MSSTEFAAYKQEAERKIAQLQAENDSLRKKFAPSWPIPLAVLTDSYKATHFLMYPPANRMVAYGEFRTTFEKDPSDQRFVFFGVRYVVEHYLYHQWTEQEVLDAERFYSTHNVGFSPYPFPKDLFMKFVRENNGYFPIKLEALPEGTVAHIHTPVYQITANGEYSRLCTFLETLLTHVWYPCSVATLSRKVKELIEISFKTSVDDDAMFLLDSRLHDFGFRGATCLEQSIIGGAAHLLNFTGSDTMSACYQAQFGWNDGKPVASSIPATEHSVMTAWPTEQGAIENMIDVFGDGIFATVMDSYDYEHALNKVVPAVAARKQAKKGLWVLRPDSGDPVDAVLQGLRAAEKTFGATMNKKGFKVLNGVAVIQGDGINKDTLRKILDAVLEAGYSAQNVAFGMGGGLLQKVNRDTMGFATKLSYIEYATGTQRDVMKLPKTDSGKVSLPGILRVKRDDSKGVGLEVVVPGNPDDSYDASDLLRVVYDHRPLPNLKWDSFDTIRARVEREWHALPKIYDPVGPQLKEKIKTWIASHQLPA